MIRVKINRNAFKDYLTFDDGTGNEARGVQPAVARWVEGVLPSQ
jgi:hypothetical protein